MNILGLNAFHGDSAACLLVNGKMVAAVEEERFRRIKHWAGFPELAIRFCLEQAHLQLSDIDVVAINTDPKAARMKKLGFLLSGQSSIALVREKILVRKQRTRLQDYFEQAFNSQRFSAHVEYVEHHLAHLASAYHVSPFESASVISVDGFGDFASTATGFGQQQDLTLQSRVYFPHSLGIFYQALTQYLGFPHYGDEYKIMGLAPYGQTKYRGLMDEIVTESSNGLFKLDLRFFRHHKESLSFEWDDGVPKFDNIYSEELESLIGPARRKDQPLEQHHMDLARSVQDKYERTFFHMLNELNGRHGSEQICIAGGCGMNSVANGKIHLYTPFKQAYVQSAAGDAGGAIGAALVAQQRHMGITGFDMSHAYWGPSFSDVQLKTIIEEHNNQLLTAGCQVDYDLKLDVLVDGVSDLIIEGKIIGWFQGAMEWGPRALGNRSILGDPRRDDMKDILNLKIKRRESFRPFAPSVLRSEVSNWFESDADVPFMMKVFQVRKEKREQVPAVTHVDGSGRLQTVTKDSNKRYHALISCFHEKTNVPMLLNTSFNENEPVVCLPEEALDCFLRTNMDVLVLGSHIIKRA